MIRALFIAFEFPPLSNTGVHRSAKFVKYLRANGVEPIVIALDPADAAKTFSAPLDDSLLADVPDDTAIYRVKCPIPELRQGRVAQAARVFFRVTEDIAARARPSLEAQLPAIMRRHKPEVVYVSMPPFSTGPLAAEVARRYSLPLVVDMRDGWSHWCSGSFPSYVHFREVLRREHALFRQAHTVVTVTEQLADVFRRSHPSLPRDRFCVVPNGFDGELPAWTYPRPTRSEGTFVVGYSGSFYYSPESRAVALTPWWRRQRHRKLHYQPTREDWLYRSPAFFFRALAELRRREPEIGQRVRFQYVGAVPPWWDAMLSEYRVGDAVTAVGRVSLAEAQALSASVDANLCTSVKVLDGGEDYALASKTFDYVLAGRPILGLVTRGAQRDFLAGAGVAVLADPDDLDACVAALKALVAGSATLARDDEFVRRYRRRETGRRLAANLTESAQLRTK